jgi:hypothetical protein
MTRRWRFTLVSAAIAVLSAAPIISSTTASAMPLSSKAASVVEPAEPGAGLAGLWNPDGTQVHVFYVGTDSQISNWYGNGKTWTNAPLGVGEPAAVGTGLTALWNPAGTQSDVFYVGTLGQIYTWSWDGKNWANKVLGKGEPAALGTGLAAYWNPDGKQANVFYVGADGQLYNWYGNGTTWNNAALGGANGEPAGLGTGLAAYWNPAGTAAHVFYVGADRALYNWYGNGTTWNNAALGGANGEPAANARNLAAYWHPDGIEANVFYVGIDGDIHDWLWTGTDWTNSSLGKGAPAGLGRGLAAFWNPDGKTANVFYMGEDGQIYNWAWTAATSWTNSALGSGVPAGQGTGLAALWDPDGKQANVFYAGDKGEPYNAPISNWSLTGTKWTNGNL